MPFGSALVIGFAVRAGYLEPDRTFLTSLAKFLGIGVVLAAVLWGVAHVATARFAQMHAFRDEAVLGVLVVAGALIYGGAILLLFGPRWLRSLVR